MNVFPPPRSGGILPRISPLSGGFRSSLLVAVLLACMTAVQAGSRTSATYTVPAESADAGGARTSSVSYSHDGSLGGVSGISTVTTPVQTAKAGYLGQLTEATALHIAAAPTTVDEGGTRQLAGWEALDDGSFNAVPASGITWSVASGPLSSIQTSGLVTADIVFADSPATAQGVYAGLTGQLGLTVLNVNTDDLPGYAGDGLDDAWQFQHFGLNNPDAAPGANPDFDPHDNAFEFLAGFDPKDATEFLKLTVDGFNAPGTLDLRLNKMIPGREYRIQFSPDLVTPFIDVGPAMIAIGEETDKLLQVSGISGTNGFYKVEIRLP